MTAQSPIQIAALTGGLKTASTRFRVRQYIQPLSRFGITVTEYIPRWGESCGLPSPFKMAARIPALFQSRRADLIWLSRELVQGYATFERLLKRPRILDVDDAIWLRPPLGRLGQPWVARGMDAVIAGNDYLADYYSRYCRSIFVVPTGIDTRRFTPKPASDNPEQPFVIGWTGSRSNHKYLQMIEPALERFLKAHPDSRFLIISNGLWKPEHIPPDRIEFHFWNPNDETRLLHRMSVGLMPLADDPWTRGKCSFKMLQYMASGLPAVVSPVGMNKQVLAKGPAALAARTIDEWVEALETLSRNPSLRQSMGQTGRRIIEEFFSVEILSERLAEIFRLVLGGGKC
ncbi:MAG TPA: glycosyltransferase family 4 protein [Anaerohalosphaeraceae bacterium]|nr:glycosyltransferase family 4 protein [Anaerohalosphaeraceae bacterium]